MNLSKIEIKRRREKFNQELEELLLRNGIGSIMLFGKFIDDKDYGLVILAQQKDIPQTDLIKSFADLFIESITQSPTMQKIVAFANKKILNQLVHGLKDDTAEENKITLKSED